MWSEFNTHFQNSKRRVGLENHQDFVRTNGVRTNLERSENNFLKVSQ